MSVARHEPEAVTIFAGLGYYPEKFLDNVSEIVAGLRSGSRRLVLEILSTPDPPAFEKSERIAHAISLVCQDLLTEALFRYEFVLEKMARDDFQSEWEDPFIERVESFFQREFLRIARRIPGMKVDPDPALVAKAKAEWMKCAAEWTERALEYCRIAPDSIHNEQAMALAAQIRHEIELEDTRSAENPGSTETTLDTPAGERQLGGPASVGPTGTFPVRASWLNDRLYERGWDKHELERQRGPTHKTTQKVLDGIGVRSDVLDRIAEALSRASKFPEVAMTDIPRQ